MEEKLAIAILVNNSMINASLTMIFSFLCTNMWFNGTLIVLYDKKYSKLSKLNKDKLTQLYKNIVFHEVNYKEYEPIVEKWREKSSFPFMASFFKLDLFNMPEYDRIVYLDSDMIINNNISGLFYTPLDFGAIPDAVSEYNKEGIFYDDEKVFYTYAYFNAGVMCISGKYLSAKKELMDLALNIDFNKAKLKNIGNCIEQDLLNEYFSDKVITLFSSSYNLQCSYYYNKENEKIEIPNTIKDVRIIHYNAVIKPWYNIGWNLRHLFFLYGFYYLYNDMYKNFINPKRWQERENDYKNYIETDLKLIGLK